MSKLAEALREEAAELVLSVARQKKIARQFSLIREKDRHLLASSIFNVQVAADNLRTLEDRTRGEG